MIARVRGGDRPCVDAEDRAGGRPGHAAARLLRPRRGGRRHAGAQQPGHGPPGPARHDDQHRRTRADAASSPTRHWRLPGACRKLLDRVMAYPQLDLPAYAYLAQYDRTRFCPGVDEVPPESITLLETNPRFIAGVHGRAQPRDEQGAPLAELPDRRTRHAVAELLEADRRRAPTSSRSTPGANAATATTCRFRRSTRSGTSSLLAARRPAAPLPQHNGRRRAGRADERRPEAERRPPSTCARRSSRAPSTPMCRSSVSPSSAPT